MEQDIQKFAAGITDTTIDFIKHEKAYLQSLAKAVLSGDEPIEVITQKRFPLSGAVRMAQPGDEQIQTKALGDERMIPGTHKVALEAVATGIAATTKDFQDRFELELEDYLQKTRSYPEREQIREDVINKRFKPYGL